MDIFEVIKARRSIRKYKPDPVDDKDLEKVLEAAHWAPSWANTQCWRFIVVKDSGIKAQVADTLQKFLFEDGWVENAASKAIVQAPVLIVVCAQEGLAGYRPDGTPMTEKDDWLLFDVALAVQNLTLAARSLELGTVIVGAFDAGKAAEILDVPKGYTVVALTPLGHPDHTGQPPPRKSLSEIVYQNKFGSRLNKEEY
jgi:nitroreductase